MKSMFAVILTSCLLAGLFIYVSNFPGDNGIFSNPFISFSKEYSQLENKIKELGGSRFDKYAFARLDYEIKDYYKIHKLTQEEFTLLIQLLNTTYFNLINSSTNNLLKNSQNLNDFTVLLDELGKINNLSPGYNNLRKQLFFNVKLFSENMRTLKECETFYGKEYDHAKADYYRVYLGGNQILQINDSIRNKSKRYLQILDAFKLVVETYQTFQKDSTKKIPQLTAQELSTEQGITFMYYIPKYQELLDKK